MSYASAETQPVENTTRGTLLSLAIIPLGVIAWVLIWNLGFVAGIVGFGIAIGALFLYRFGSGGIVSRGGAVRVALVTLLTVLIAMFATLVSDVVNALSEISGISAIETITHEAFWPSFQEIVTAPEVSGEYAKSFAIGLGLALLGSFSTLRGAFTQPAPTALPATEQYFSPAGTEPNAPAYGNTVYPTTSGPGVNEPTGFPQYGEQVPPATPAVDGPTEPQKDQA